MYKSPLVSINSPATHLIPRCIPFVAIVGLGLAVEIMLEEFAEAGVSNVRASNVGALKEADMPGISAYVDGLDVVGKSSGVV